MENIYVYLMFSIISGLVISVITALVSVDLSFKRFRKERSWERKADSYASIIEALHHMKDYCMKELESLESVTELSEDSKKELWAKSKKGIDNLSMAADVGTFIISNEAVACLKDFQKKYQGTEFGNDVYGYFDSQAAIIEECLNSLREMAKRDLGLK